MEFSLWRKDGVGNRCSVSKSSTDVGPTVGYIIQVAEGKWVIEGGELEKIYPTAQDAAEILIERDSN